MFASAPKRNKAKTPEAELHRADGATGEKTAPELNPVWQSLATRPHGIQTKLAVSQPDDPYEQEADRVADRVMRMTTLQAANSTPSLSSSVLSGHSANAMNVKRRKKVRCTARSRAVTWTLL